jgi:hypothetical protein
MQILSATIRASAVFEPLTTYAAGSLWHGLPKASPYTISLQKKTPTAPLANGGDDFASDTSTTGVLVIGSSVTGTIDFEGDQDWFRMSLVADEQVTFTTTLGPDATLTIYDSAGTALFSDFAVDPIDYTAATSGTYYIGIEYGFIDPDGFSPVDYSISSSNAGPDAPGDTSTDVEFSVGETVNGRIDGDTDDDWIRFFASANETVLLSVTSTGVGEYQLRIRNENGTIVTDTTELFSFYDTIQVSTTLTNGGTYYLDISSTSATASSYTATFVNQVDDFAGDTSTSATLSLDTELTAAHEQNTDIDWFRFTASAGDNLAFILESAEPYQQQIAFYDAAGNFTELQGNDIPISGARGIYFEVTTSGTYYIGITSGDFPAGYNYALTMTTSSDDYAGSSFTTGSIAQNGSVNGVIDFADDSDWFRFTATAEEIRQFNLTFDPTFAYTLEIYDDNGTSVSNGIFNAGTGNASITMQFQDAGTYYAAVTGSQIVIGLDNDYTLTSASIEDDFDANPNSVGIIYENGRAKGNTEVTGDNDWFSFSATAGDVFFFSLDKDNGTGYDVNIYNAAGTLVAGSERVWNNEYFQAAASGTYFVEVSSESTSVLVNETYVLTREDIVDEAAGSISSNKTIEDGSLVAGTIGTTNDEDWYGFTVTAGDQFSFNFAYEGSGLLEILLYSDDGTLQDASPQDTVIEALVSGTFYIAVSDSSAQFEAPIDYYLTMSGPDQSTFMGLVTDDTLAGSATDDMLYGLDGQDFIGGAGGNDTLIGGLGADRLSGGSGQDVFLISDMTDGDMITDFTPGADKVDLTGLDTFELVTQNGRGTIVNVRENLAFIDHESGVALVLQNNAKTVLAGFQEPIVIFEGLSVEDLSMSDLIL